MVDVIAELPPLRGLGDVEAYLSRVGEVVDYVTHLNIPDSTFANPSANSILVGSLIRRRFDVNLMCNVRVADHNRVGLVSLLLGGLVNGVDSFLVMRGDLGPGVTAVQDFTPVSAIVFLKGVEALRGARFGISISSFSDDYIDERLRIMPHFAMTQYTLSMDDLAKVARIASKYGVPVYPPLIVVTSRSARIIGKILNTEIPVPQDPVEDAVNRARELLKMFQGFYITSPGDFGALINVAKRLGLK
jgi:homocysteine S-methyltransferase